jgi:DNA-binding beta-propeller fold protein YncE
MKSLNYSTLCIAILVLLISCSPKKPAEDQAATSTALTTPTLTEVWATDTLLKTPESVIYDPANGVIYVSNVNQNPWVKDENGFISKISKTGEILALEWVTGFSGPKGMGIMGDTLFVADLDELVLVSISNGAVIEKIKIDGASGLNDITTDNGVVFISDSNAGKIYQYANGEVTVFHPDVPGRPNGLLPGNGKLLVAFSETSEFISIDPVSLEKIVIADSIGAGDGITPTTQDGCYLVSDWNGEVFYVDNAGNKTSLLNTKEQKKNTADIWFITEENCLLVPTFFDNRVVAYKLQ